MPALPSVPQVLKIVLRQSQASGDLDVINRFYMKYSGTPPTDSDLVTFAGAVSTEWASDIAPLVHANGSLTGVFVTDLTSATAAVGADLTVHAGTRSGVVLSAAAALVLQFKIARRYRGGHPRAYLDAGVEGDLLTRSNWNPSLLTAAVTAWNAFINAIDAAPWSGATLLGQVNVSFYSGFTNHTFPSGRVRPIPTLRGTPLVDLVFDTGANPKVGSQRRRNLQSA